MCQFKINSTAGKGNLRKEKHLDSNSQCRMQNNNQYEQNLASLSIRSIQDRVQVPQKEEDSPSKANTNKRPVKRSQRTPANQRNGNPNQIRVSIQSPALNKVSRGATEPAQRTPQRNRQDTRVPIDQPSGTGQQLKVILKVLVVIVRQPLRDSTRQKQNHYHRRRDPDRSVQVCVTL